MVRLPVIRCVDFVFQDGGFSDGRDGGEGGGGDNLLDITGAPGYEYLAPAERLLCSQLHMTPGPYLAIKVGASVVGLLFLRPYSRSNSGAYTCCHRTISFILMPGCVSGFCLTLILNALYLF